MRETKTKKIIFGVFVVPLLLVTLGVSSLFRVAPVHAITAPEGGGGPDCGNSTIVYYFSKDRKTVSSEAVGTATDGSSCKIAGQTFTQLATGFQYKVGGNNGACGDTIVMTNATATSGKYISYNKPAGGLCTATNGNGDTVNVAASEAAAVKAVASDTATDGTDADQKSSCAIDGIGWIVCPVANFAGTLVDGLYGYVADNFLSVNTDLVSNDSATYKAWAGLLAIANVIFVIIFLVIIFSQATGFGISNYGIKKMLPKLIVGVVLINVSYFLCQAAVDISNIFGYGLRSVFSTLGTAEPISWATVIQQVLSVGLVGGAIAVASVGFGLSFVLLCLLTIIFIALLLVVRQVLVIVCVVTAPLAFAAWLLPNTEKLFKLWWKIFYQMLIVFPIVALIIGASALASEVVRKSLSSDDTADATAGMIVNVGREEL